MKIKIDDTLCTIESVDEVYYLKSHPYATPSFEKIVENILSKSQYYKYVTTNCRLFNISEKSKKVLIDLIETEKLKK